jgi:hypothetical protein
VIRYQTGEQLIGVLIPRRCHAALPHRYPWRACPPVRARRACHVVRRDAAGPLGSAVRRALVRGRWAGAPGSDWTSPSRTRRSS